MSPLISRGRGGDDEGGVGFAGRGSLRSIIELVNILRD